jgi:hypothetical protein
MAQAKANPLGQGKPRDHPPPHFGSPFRLAPLAGTGDRNGNSLADELTKEKAR